jgi:hypothetical protein
MKKFLTILLILALLSLGVSSALAQEDGTEETPQTQEASEPTTEPAAEPTAEPTQEATAEPTAEPTVPEPTAEPTAEPTQEATSEPTVPEPTTEPTAEPTSEPTVPEPTTEPTAEPTEAPVATVEPTAEPTVEAVVESAGELGSQTLTNIPFTSKVAVMDISGSGANFSISYFDNSTDGGGARGATTNLDLSAFQMRLIDQATDGNITGSNPLKGSAILQSNNPLASVVFFGGKGAGGYREFEAYDSGGLTEPDVKFFLPNGFKNISSGGKFLNSEIAIMNTDSSNDATVLIEGVNSTDPLGTPINRTITVEPNSTYYYNLEDESQATTGRYAMEFTSQNGQEILVLSTQYSFGGGKPGFVTKTAGFKPSDASNRQYLPNILSRLNNGFSVTHFVQNISNNPVNITITYIPDSGKPNVTPKTATLGSGEVFTVNPRTKGVLPTNWSGAAIASTDDNSNSIVAFTNQVNSKNGNSSGVNARGANNSGEEVYCPYFINNGTGGRASTLQIQNVSGQDGVQVQVTFRAGIGSANNNTATPAAFTLNDGGRQNFNARVGPVAGLPKDWYGSVVVESLTPGAEVSAIVSLFEALGTKDDPLGSYNCITP